MSSEGVTSINFKVIGLTRTGFENGDAQIRTRDIRIPRSPRTEGGCFAHSVGWNVQYIGKRLYLSVCWYQSLEGVDEG